MTKSLIGWLSKHKLCKLDNSNHYLVDCRGAAGVDSRWQGGGGVRSSRPPGPLPAPAASCLLQQNRGMFSPHTRPPAALCLLSCVVAETLLLLWGIVMELPSVSRKLGVFLVLLLLVLLVTANLLLTVWLILALRLNSQGGHSQAVRPIVQNKQLKNIHTLKLENRN